MKWNAIQTDMHNLSIKPNFFRYCKNVSSMLKYYNSSNCIKINYWYFFKSYYQRPENIFQKELNNNAHCMCKVISETDPVRICKLLVIQFYNSIAIFRTLKIVSSDVVSITIIAITVTSQAGLVCMMLIFNEEASNFAGIKTNMLHFFFKLRNLS